MNTRHNRRLSPCLSLFAMLFGLTLSLTGCPSPDTEGGYAEYLHATEDMRASGDMGVPDGISGDFSGTYLFAIKTPLGDPVLFEATVVARTASFDLTLQPLKTDNLISGNTRDDARSPTGDAIVTTDIPIEDGSFTIFYPDIQVPADSNPITFQDLVAELTFDGAVISLDELCGTVSGELVVPFTLDLTGSTFGAIRTDDVLTAEVVGACPQ